MKISINNMFECYKEDDIDVLIVFGHQGFDATNATFKFSSKDRPKLQFGKFGEMCQNEDVGKTALYTICDLKKNSEGITTEGFTDEEMQDALREALQPLFGKYKNVGILTPTPIGYNHQDVQSKALHTYQVVSTVKNNFDDHWPHGEVILYTMTW